MIDDMDVAIFRLRIGFVNPCVEIDSRHSFLLVPFLVLLFVGLYFFDMLSDHDPLFVPTKDVWNDKVRSPGGVFSKRGNIEGTEWQDVVIENGLDNLSVDLLALSMARVIVIIGGWARVSFQIVDELDRLVQANRPAEKGATDRR